MYIISNTVTHQVLQSLDQLRRAPKSSMTELEATECVSALHTLYTMTLAPIGQQASHPPTHSLIHSITHSFTPLTHSLTNPLTQSPTHPLTQSLTRPLTHPLTHSPTHPLNHPLTHSLTHSITHSLTHSPTHPLTHSLTHYSGCRKECPDLRAVSERQHHCSFPLRRVARYMYTCIYN